MSFARCDNILIRGVNWIGDAVMTLPAIESLRRSHPEARITLLVKPWVAPVFEGNPHIDEILFYKDEHEGFAGKFRLASELRGKKFCMAVLLQNAFDAAVTAFMAGIPEVIGYSRDGRRLLLTTPVASNDKTSRLHHVDYYLHLLRSAGFSARTSSPWIHLRLGERLAARKALAHLRRPVIGINPGAAYGSSKRWHSDRFAEVALRIMQELGGSVVLFGSSGETAIAEQIVGTIKQSAPGIRDEDLMVMTGKTGLRELIALISECDLLVTNDSGPMHIGYATGTPLVAVFGSTSPELTGPIGPGAIVLRKPVGCSPCFERECSKGDLQCMDLITPDEVFDSVKELLGTKRAIFFDRDGTLCRDPGYLNRIEDFEIFPDTKHLAMAKDKGFMLIGVTNQSGIARGIVDETFVKHVNTVFIEQYGFDAFYYCPHGPDEGCSCRKPEPGMLISARNDFRISLKDSFVIGDKDVDMLLARSVGARGILVKTGQHMTSENADYSAENLGEAVRIIAGSEVRKRQSQS